MPKTVTKVELFFFFFYLYESLLATLVMFYFLNKIELNSVDLNWIQFFNIISDIWNRVLIYDSSCFLKLCMEVYEADIIALVLYYAIKY